MYKTRSESSGSNSNSPKKRYRFGGGKKFKNKSNGGGNSHFSNTKKRSGGGRKSSKSAELDVSTFINKTVISTEIEEKYIPEHSFVNLPINEILRKNILSRGYTQLAPIQDKTIPHILRGEDVVGLANTGTGKTAAFLIPLINKVARNKTEQIIILTPTRELAIQIDDELKSFTKEMRIFSTVCVGGTPIYKQIRQLRNANHFIIGTPGRVMDLMERGVLKLDTFKTIVLDEADRMLDMGFISDMRFVMSKMTKQRQTLFFSATMSPVIKNLIKDFLNSPMHISVKTRDTSKNVDQDIVRIKGGSKLDILEKLLANPEFNKVLVFGRTKHGVEKISKALLKRGVKSESIHGNKSHGQRQRSLKKFKDNSVQTLIATDVAARGLDINDVSHVINYDVPKTYDDYIHRIGRTGRADKTGKALTFVE